MKPERNNLIYIFCTIVFIVGMLAFLIYGLSFFAASPSTIETITTDAPPLDANNQPVRGAKFRTLKKKR